MAGIDNASEDLFFKLRNRFPKISIYDENGKSTIDPEAARFFTFQYTDKDSGRTYGSITCSLVDGNSLKVFFDMSITDTMLPEDKNYWYRFLRELRRMAKSHMLNFDVRDITKDVLTRRDYEYLTKTNPEKKKMKESLEESRVMWQRKGKVSEGNLNNVRIHVVHNERMMENPNNRLLKVDRIFLVNESGEKFLLPFKSVSGAKAMANHVSRGGNPYDSNGQIISRAVSEMRNLGRFASVTRSRTFEAAEANNVIRAAQTVKENLKRHLNRLSNNSRSFNESLEALAEFIGEQVDDVTEVKAWFTQQTYNENLDNYLASAAGAYKKLRENTMNKLDEVSDSVKNKILDKNFKLVLKADAGLDKLITSRSYTDSKAMAVAILGDIANRLVTPNGDDVANFAALMGDLMSSEGDAFGQKKDDPEYDSDKKLAILLAQKYLKELNLIKQNPKLEREYRQDVTRKAAPIKGRKNEAEQFAEEIMGIGEEESVDEAMGTVKSMKAATKFDQSNIAKMDREEKARKAKEKEQSTKNVKKEDAVNEESKEGEGSHFVMAHSRVRGLQSPLKGVDDKIKKFKTREEAKQYILDLNAKNTSPHVYYTYGGEMHEDAVTEEPNEGNEFSGALAAAKASGKKEFEVDGKTYQVKEAGPADEPEHEDDDADDKRWDDKEEKVEETKMSKEISEMRKLAGLPLMENYVYAQEEDDTENAPDTVQHDGEPSADDKAEYDQEGRMGKNRLSTIVDAAQELEKMLQDNENLPEWVQDKITMAADYIDTVRDYMKSNDVEYTDEAHVEEAKKAKPDYLDFDKDGDKEESMKKALADKKKMKESADLTWLQAVAGIKSK
jgi:6-pyruvoyl-tetrahydropterin synthase